VQVGTGAVVGLNQIMEHTKTNHPEVIRSIGVSNGWDVGGRWEISSIQGLSLNTLRLDEYTTMLRLGNMVVGYLHNY